MQEHKQNKGYKSIALPPTLLPLLDSWLSVPLHCFLHAEFTRSNTTDGDFWIRLWTIGPPNVPQTNETNLLGGMHE